MPDTDTASGKRSSLGLGNISAISVGVFLRQCVSALSSRFHSEPICEPLYGDASSHREAWHPPHTWPDQDSLRPPHEDPKHKIHPCKVPTSILRRRSNLIGSSPVVSRGQKSVRKVHFRDPEFTVYTYCVPGHPPLTFLTCLLILSSVLLVLLFCTNWHQSLRLCEVPQAVMGKLAWGFWLWLTMQ